MGNICGCGSKQAVENPTIENITKSASNSVDDAAENVATAETKPLEAELQAVEEEDERQKMFNSFRESALSKGDEANEEEQWKERSPSHAEIEAAQREAVEAAEKAKKFLEESLLIASQALELEDKAKVSEARALEAEKHAKMKRDIFKKAEAEALKREMELKEIQDMHVENLKTIEKHESENELYKKELEERIADESISVVQRRVAENELAQFLASVDDTPLLRTKFTSQYSTKKIQPELDALTKSRELAQQVKETYEEALQKAKDDRKKASAARKKATEKRKLAASVTEQAQQATASADVKTRRSVRMHEFAIAVKEDITTVDSLDIVSKTKTDLDQIKIKLDELDNSNAEEIADILSKVDIEDTIVGIVDETIKETAQLSVHDAVDEYLETDLSANEKADVAATTVTAVESQVKAVVEDNVEAEPDKTETANVAESSVKDAVVETTEVTKPENTAEIIKVDEVDVKDTADEAVARIQEESSEPTEADDKADQTTESDAVKPVPVTESNMGLLLKLKDTVLVSSNVKDAEKTQLEFIVEFPSEELSSKDKKNILKSYDFTFCWVDPDGNLHHFRKLHTWQNDEEICHMESTTIGHSFIVFHNKKVGDNSKVSTLDEFKDSEKHLLVCNYTPFKQCLHQVIISIDVDITKTRSNSSKKKKGKRSSKLITNIVYKSASVSLKCLAKRDDEYRVCVYLPKAIPGILPSAENDWSVTFRYLVPKVPTNKFNSQMHTFYVWGNLDFHYGADAPEKRSIHNYTMNQIVPQTMIGNCLYATEDEESYIPKWKQFDSWVIQAQYYWQDQDEGSHAKCGKVIDVKPGDEIETIIKYSGASGVIDVSIYPLNDPTNKSEISLDRPFPDKPSMFSSWKQFLEKAQEASATAGAYGRPVMNVEYKGKVDVGTLKSLGPFTVTDISYPGTDIKTSEWRTLFYNLEESDEYNLKHAVQLKDKV